MYIVKLTNGKRRAAYRRERRYSPFSDSARRFGCGRFITVFAEELVKLNTGMNDRIRMVGMFSSSVTFEILISRHLDELAVNYETRIYLT